MNNDMDWIEWPLISSAQVGQAVEAISLELELSGSFPNRTIDEARSYSRMCRIEGPPCLVRDVYQYRVVSRPVIDTRPRASYAAAPGTAYRTLIWDMDAPRGRRRLVFKSQSLMDTIEEGVWYGTEVVLAHVEGWRPSYGPRSVPVELP